MLKKAHSLQKEKKAKEIKTKTTCNFKILGLLVEAANGRHSRQPVMVHVEGRKQLSASAFPFLLFFILL